VAKANTGLVGVEGISSLGIVAALAKALVTISGVSATTALGDVVVANNARPTFDGVSATGAVGTVTVTTTIFDYPAVAHLYDRRRTIYVERQSTAKERTVMVLAQSRRVYVDKNPTDYDRTSYVA
jgi:hypothetical protein